MRGSTLSHQKPLEIAVRQRECHFWVGGVKRSTFGSRFHDSSAALSTLLETTRGALPPVLADALKRVGAAIGTDVTLCHGFSSR